MMENKHTLRILIVEDEIILAHTMKEMLHELGYKSIVTAYNINLSKSIIHEGKVDLAILDINLGQGEEGIELAQVCQSKNIPFFYVSSYTDKATLDKALKTAPGAYLVKPYLQSNLYTALQITLTSKTEAEKQTISIKDGTAFVNLNLTEIIYIQSDNIYLKIVTSKKNYLVRDTISNFIERLPDRIFIQTHRSYIINTTYFTRFQSDTISLGEVEIPVSRSFKSKVKEHFSLA